MRRGLLIASVVLVALLILAVGGATWFVRGSLPQLEGTRTLPGLAAEVTVERDAIGVPLITAGSREDAARALGFVHAQERFFQMDLLRRASSGELAALLGADLVDVDRAHRVHRFRTTAAEAVAALPPHHRAVLTAYAEGVNAGLDALRVRPWEYAVLGQRPEAWREEDSFLVAASMFLELQSSDLPREMERAAIEATLPEALAAFLYPGGDAWDAPLDGSVLPAPPVPTPDQLDGFRPGPPPADTVRTQDGPGLGSNAWAVAGSRSASGVALLAGDMHLGLRLPHIWYRAALAYPAEGGTRRVVGVTLPGVPAVVVGSNGHVAWSFTNSYGDYFDTVRLELERPGIVRTADRLVPLDTLREVIRVAGADADTLDILMTPFGPVVGTDHAGESVALRWTAHHAEAFNLVLMDLEGVETVAEAAALGPRIGIPAQNMHLADATGSVGWTLAGRIPIRTHDGQRPTTSTDPEAAWSGFRDAAPQVLDPEDGLIWTANNRVVSGDDLAAIGLGPYSHGARAFQIRELLDGAQGFREADMLAVQLDDRALVLQRWRDLLLETLDAAEPTETRRAVREAVAAWEGRATAEAVGYPVVRAFRNRVAAAALLPLTAPARAALGDTVIVETEAPTWSLVTERPPHLLAEGVASWEALLLDAADEAARACDGSFQTCTWGEANRLRMAHPFADVLPFVGGRLAMPEAEQPGDSRVPRVSGPSFGASQRLVVAPGREEDGFLHMPGGQAGHPFAPYWGAGHDDWLLGRPAPLLPGAPRWTLRLTP